MAVNDGIVVGVDTIDVSPGVRIIFGCCAPAIIVDVAGFIVVDEIKRGPSLLIVCSAGAFVTVTILVAGDARLDDAALPSFLIEKTM